MDQNTLNQMAQQDGAVNVLPPSGIPDPSAAATPGTSGAPEDISNIINLARMVRRPITTAPSVNFVPKTFLEQFQFYDDGSEQRAYFWDNNAWRYVKLGPLPGPLGFATHLRTHLSTNQAMAGTNEKVRFDVIDVDGNLEYDNTLFRWTAKVAGTYFITAACDTAEAGTTAIYKNGSLYSFVSGSIASDHLSLAVNDYIEIWYSKSPAGTIVGTNNSTYLSIIRTS